MIMKQRVNTQSNTIEPEEAEELYEILARNSPVGVYIVQDGRICFVNPEFQKITGYSEDELLGMKPLDIVHPEDRERVKQQAVAMLKGETFNPYEFRAIHKDGTVHWGLETITSVYYQGKRASLGNFMEITELKRMEEALKFTEAAFKSIHKGIIVTDSESTITYWNQMCEELFGIKASEAIGKNIIDVTKPIMRYPGQDKALNTNLLNRGYNQDVIIFNTPRGKAWVDVTIQVIKIDGEIRGNVLTFQDITDRKKADKAMKESEEKYRSVVENADIGIVVIQDNHLVFFNPWIQKTFGYTEDDFSKSDFISMIHPDDREVIVIKVKERLADIPADESTELRALTKFGEVRWIDAKSEKIQWNGKPAIQAFIRDITERKLEEEKHRIILKTSLDGFAIEDLKGNILEVNDSYCMMHGYTRSELLGKTIMDIEAMFPSEDHNKIIAHILEIRSRRFETKHRCKDGRIIDVEVSANYLDIGEGQIFVFVRDITERTKRIEQEREANNLRELDRMRTELLANVSHELRTPLASIKGFTTLLMDYANKLEPDEKDEYLEIINHNTDRLSELIERLLVMSRLDAGILAIDREPSDINTLCREAVAEAKIWSPEHKFMLNLPARLPLTYIDPRRIRQVLDNLIDNAIKFSDPGTGITITTCHNGRKEILVTVTDNGPGIPLKNQRHIFDRRFHTERNHKPGTAGAGPGLSICKGLVEAHQGRIWIESREGQGTSCFFTVSIHDRRGGGGHGKNTEG